MRASSANPRSRSARAAIIGALIGFGVSAPAFANVITDWDEKALLSSRRMASLASPTALHGSRMMGMVHAAMFDAVNSIERRHRPYLVQLPADHAHRRKPPPPRLPPRSWRQSMQRRRTK